MALLPNGLVNERNFAKQQQTNIRLEYISPSQAVNSTPTSAPMLLRGRGIGRLRGDKAVADAELGQ